MRAVCRSLSNTEKAERMMGRFRSLVCIQCLPLPTAMEQLRAEYPSFFPNQQEISRELCCRSFGEIWSEAVHQMGFSGHLERILIPIGRELSTGEDPESCFERVRLELLEYRTECIRQKREAVRLYPALGLSAGCLLAILLI